MQGCLLEDRPPTAIPISVIQEESFGEWREHQDEPLQRWITATGFRAKPGSVCLVPKEGTELGKVLVGIRSPTDPWSLGSLPLTLPQGAYYLDTDWPAEVSERAAVGWGLGAYQFTRYKTQEPSGAQLAIPTGCHVSHVQNQVEAIYLIRDLINTPAEDMMPEQLADAMVCLGREYGADIQQFAGDELLTHNFPAIHAVGRASQRAPRLVDLRWGEGSHPKLTLAGKGVCFDSGGLDLKTAAGMRLMKKDMGGAAHALGLARMVMAAERPVRLRVLVAAVENAVSGNALRPGDIIRTRTGLTVEVDNTDAEGRLILCDALAEGAREKPDLMLDFATLTGAARMALGTDIPALFCPDDAMARELLTSAEQEQDPLWQLPLYAPYRELLESKVADLINSPTTPYAGAITAALFLREFVPIEIPWAHFDLMAWNTTSRPGRPEGGEAMGVRAVFRYLMKRF